MEENDYNYYKCWSFGKSMKVHYGELEWRDITELPEWKEFVEKHNINMMQSAYARRGYNGDPIVREDEDALVTFEPFNGKALSQLNRSQIQYLKRQDWISNHPVVELHLKYNERYI